MESNNTEAGHCPCESLAHSKSNIELFVGLGNPGDSYVGTRHNTGFLVADAFLNAAVSFVLCEWQPEEGNLFKASFAHGSAYVLKPMAFMNNSGIAVGETTTQLGISPRNIMVVCDDLDLEPGRIRVRLKGSSGGHKGLASIASTLQTEDFPRLKVGIGRPQSRGDSIVNYVLSPWASDELPYVEGTVKLAVSILTKAVTEQPEPCTVSVNDISPDEVNATKQGVPEVEEI